MLPESANQAITMNSSLRSSTWLAQGMGAGRMHYPKIEDRTGLGQCRLKNSAKQDKTASELGSASPFSDDLVGPKPAKPAKPESDQTRPEVGEAGRQLVLERGGTIGGLANRERHHECATAAQTQSCGHRGKLSTSYVGPRMLWRKSLCLANSW